MPPSIVWFRQDLRLADQPALAAAATLGPIIPVYVLDEHLGGASRWWLHHSLTALAAAFTAKGIKLILRRGDAASELRSIAARVGATQIHANRHYEPWWRTAESELAGNKSADHRSPEPVEGQFTRPPALRQAQGYGSNHIDLILHHGNQLADPNTIRSGTGGRYKVFTPWWRALLTTMPPPRPLSVPDMTGHNEPIASHDLDDWKLLPTNPDWSAGFDWTPGEDGARAALRTFLPRLIAYGEARNRPSEPGTSRLSPHLHFGEISPATVWHHAAKAAGPNAEPFLREIGWRDYAANLLDQFPDYDTRNGRASFDALTWRSGADADADFTAWTRGRTGYPIVDAGMRELWTTGFMHNRVRMITASFLIKHLLIDWRRGERWFWDTLLDADAASNASNWQWVAGTGVDAPMFSRIMAPLGQSEKFNAVAYIRRWVPELRDLSEPYLHDPDGHGVCVPGYPAPLVGHREARERALGALAGLKT